MPKEIERKFLVRGDGWRSGAAGLPIRQGYLCTDVERNIRVRTRGEHGYLTIKGAMRGLAREEFEYAIPRDDANAMLDGLCQRPLIEKTRYVRDHGGCIWEIDVFEGENAGLIIAEVELQDEDQDIALPAWVGAEVSNDTRYFNVNLFRHPFTRW